jgi:hypothetical protein
VSAPRDVRPAGGGAAGHGGAGPAPAERPPLGGWGRLYALVALELVLVIALLGWVTRTFR